MRHAPSLHVIVVSPSFVFSPSVFDNWAIGRTCCSESDMAPLQVLLDCQTTSFSPLSPLPLLSSQQGPRWLGPYILQRHWLSVLLQGMHVLHRVHHSVTDTKWYCPGMSPHKPFAGLSGLDSGPFFLLHEVLRPPTSQDSKTSNLHFLHIAPHE